MLGIGGIVICAIFLLSVVVEPLSMPLFTPVVISFGNSKEVNTAVNTLEKNYPNVDVIRYKDIHSISAALTLMRSHSILILVGHGNTDGILNSNKIISWQQIGNWVNSLPNNKIIFLSCNSNSVKPFIDKPFYGFTGNIDAVLGALAVAAALKINSHQDLNGVFNLGSQFQERYNKLITNEIIPLNLAATESGYSLAFEKQYIYTQECVWGVCVKLTEENILWINADTVIGGGLASGVLSVIGKYSNQIGAAVAGSVGEWVIDGVTLTAAWWAGIVFALIVAIWASIIINMGCRKLNDMKIGIGAEYVPINVIYYKMDDQASGIWSVPVTDNPILPAAFGILPSHWVKILS